MSEKIARAKRIIKVLGNDLKTVKKGLADASKAFAKFPNASNFNTLEHYMLAWQEIKLNMPLAAREEKIAAAWRVEQEKKKDTPKWRVKPDEK